MVESSTFLQARTTPEENTQDLHFIVSTEKKKNDFAIARSSMKLCCMKVYPWRFRVIEYILKQIIVFGKKLLNAQHLKSVQVCSNAAQMKCDSLINVPFLFLLVPSEKQQSLSGLVFCFLYYLVVQTFCTVQCCVLFSRMNIKNKMTLVLKHKHMACSDVVMDTQFLY